MGVPRLRAVIIAGLLAAPVGLAGCSLGGSDDSGGAGGTGAAPSVDGGQKARERVQAYLDAMKTKNVPTGRGQLCAPLQGVFDKTATSRNGDFAHHFKVTGATITDVRADAGRQQVSTTVKVAVGKQAMSRAIVFVVTPVEDTWCISGEEPATATPTQGVSPSPAT